MKERLDRVIEQVKRWHAYRAWQRMNDTRGTLMAAGIAYFAFFSLFPAFALAAVVFGFVLRGRPDLLEAIGTSLNGALPGFVKTADNPDGLIQLAAPEAATLSWAGAVAFVTLVLGGLGWISSLRTGLRAVFGASGSVGNAVTEKLRDLGVFALLGVSVLISAVLTSVATAAAQWLAALVGLEQVSWAVTLAGVLVSLLVDTLIMLVLLRVLSGVPLAWRDIRSGVLVGGIGLTTLKLLGATLVARATANPLFGSVVVVVGLLFWLNLIARLILLTAAWAAESIDEALLAELTAGSPQAADQDAPATGAHPDTAGAAGTAGVGDSPAVDAAAAEAAATEAAALALARARSGLPDLSGVSRRDKDRVSLAAGAVLGAGAAVGLGALGRLARALVPRPRARR